MGDVPGVFIERWFQEARGSSGKVQKLVCRSLFSGGPFTNPFNSGFADPVKWVKKGKRFRNPSAQESPESPRPSARGWRKTPPNTRPNSPEKSWWGKSLPNTRINSPARSWPDWSKGEPLPVVDSLGREVTPWPRPDEARALREAEGCRCKNRAECRHNWPLRYWRGVE